MIKKFFFFIVPVMMSITGWTQKTVFTYPEVGGKDYSIISIACINEKDKTLCLGLKDNTKIEYFLFSPEFKLISKVSPSDGLKKTAYAFEKQQLMKAIVNNTGFNFIYWARDKKVFNNAPFITVQTINFDKKEVSLNNSFIIADEESWIENFTSGNKYYGVLCNKKTDQLIINTLNADGKTERKTIFFGLENFYKAKNVNLFDYFFFSRDFTPSQETGLKEGSDLAKFFAYPDKAVITVQKDKEPPHILNLDLATMTLTKKKLSMDGFCGFAGKKQPFYNNAYIFDSNLYVLNVCKDMIEIGIFNPETGALLKHHQILESDEAFFDATSSRVIGQNEKEKELKTKELIKKMMRGSLGIVAAKNRNGNVVLTCGTYDDTQFNGGGYYVGGFTAGTQNFDPNKHYNQGKSNKITLVTSFKIVLDKEKLTLLPGQDVESRYDKIQDYSQNFQPTAQANSRYLFPFNGKLYFGFYDAAKKAYLIQYLEDDK
ncbi:MAG TPA: hypothetical protein VK483_08300 [Chitinophagaceae bacterium]|nr:hypothetical protein [Chitinophagaceae bacterium]